MKEKKKGQRNHCSPLPWNLWEAHTYCGPTVFIICKAQYHNPPWKNGYMTVAARSWQRGNFNFLVAPSIQISKSERNNYSAVIRGSTVDGQMYHPVPRIANLWEVDLIRIMCVAIYISFVADSESLRSQGDLYCNHIGFPAGGIALLYLYRPILISSRLQNSPIFLIWEIILKLQIASSSDLTLKLELKNLAWDILLSVLYLAKDILGWLSWPNIPLIATLGWWRCKLTG